MPEGKSPEIRLPKISHDAITSLRSDVKRITGTESSLSLQHQILPNANIQSEVIPSLESVIRKNKPPVDKTETLATPPSSVSDFVEAVKSGDAAGMAEAGGRLSQVQTAQEVPEPFRSEEHLMVAHNGSYDDKSPDASRWSLDKLKAERDRLEDLRAAGSIQRMDREELQEISEVIRDRESNQAPGVAPESHHDNTAGHHEIDRSNFEDVIRHLGVKRKERLEVLEIVRVRAIEEAKKEARENPKVREKALEDELARLTAIRDKKVEDRELRKAKCQASGVPFDEPEIPEVKFGEEEQRLFETPIPKFLEESELEDYKTPEERVILEKIAAEVDDYTESNKENIEYLASPEWGIKIAKRIMKWEGMRKAGSYKEIEWDDLELAYEEQIIHTEALRLTKLNTASDGEDKEADGKENDAKKPEKTVLRPIDAEKLGATGRDITELLEDFRKKPNLDEKFYKDVDVFFQQARYTGIFDDLDKVLSNVYTTEIARGIGQGLSATDIMQGNENNRFMGASAIIDRAKLSAQEIFRARLTADPNMARMAKVTDDGYLDIDESGRVAGVWDLYAEMAKRRFWAAARAGDESEGGEALRPYTENEFHLDQTRRVDVPERYWRVSEVGYLQIYARTPEEYSIAADTYITDAQARTSDPSEVFQDVTQFLKQLTQSSGHQSEAFKLKLRESVAQSKGEEEAEKADLEDLSSTFLKKLTITMQARSGVMIADHSNELYHGAQYKQGMDFMAKDGEGPNRWLALMQIPGVAEALWKLDNDPRYETHFALHGSRGQLASDTAAQKNNEGGLYGQIQHVLVEELMGTRITKESNRSKVAEDMPEKKFAAMFDGLYEYGKVPADGFQGDGNIKIFKKYGYLKEEDMGKIPAALREAYHLGRIQYLLLPKDRGGEGLGHHDLSASDTHRLQKAEAQAHKAVHIAMEIYGALGEKSKRGGGVFKVWKVDENGKEYFDFVPTHQGEKFAQFAETVTEMNFADDAQFWRSGIPQYMKDDVIGKRIIDDNIKDRKNPLANFKARYRAAKVAQARDKAFEEFAGREQVVNTDGTIRGDLTSAEKEILSIPVKDMDDAVQRKVAEKLNVVRRGGKGFEAKLYEYSADGRRSTEPLRINRPLDVTDPVTGKEKAATKGDFIGYDENGKEVFLDFDEAAGSGLKGITSYDKDGRVKLYNKKQNGERINMHLTQFTRTETKKMPILDKKGQKKFVEVLVERAAVDFSLATNHFFGDWTSHTYWSYQEEDRSLLLSQKSFAEARQIREGTLRPEDASVWGRQLLLVDPTLTRVMRFGESKQEDHERKLTMAAVEHKYQSHWRISRELHHAFFPTFGTPVQYNGLYYGLQDFGGYRKMLESARAQIGEDSERFARRGKRLIPDLHIPYAAASEMWGAGSKGIMGVMRMFNAPVYRAVGTMALDKFSAQSDAANKMRSALVESRNSAGGYEESLLLKPTNNSDKLSAAMRGVIPVWPQAVEAAERIYKKFKWINHRRNEPYATVKTQSDYAYAVIESLGRYKTYMQLFPLIETGIRNAPGAFWFEANDKKAVDVFIDRNFTDEIMEKVTSMPVIPEGEAWNSAQTKAFHREKKETELLLERTFKRTLNIKEVDDSGSPDTGSSRHSAKIFHDIFGAFLVEQGERGGGKLYKGERFAYARIYDKMLEYDDKGEVVEGSGDIWDFVLTKLVPT